MAITKSCKNPELAWKLANYLYYDADQLGERFAATNILPPLKEAWTRPELNEPRPFFSNQALGKVYAALAPQVPAEIYTPFTNAAVGRLSEAFTNTALYYEANGDRGLEEFSRKEVTRCAELVRTQMSRNRFLRAEGHGRDAHATEGKKGAGT